MANETGSRLLIDTSVWLEYLRNQERDREVERMFREVSLGSMLITEFAIGSIGLNLTTFSDNPDVFRQFVSDLLIDGGMGRVALSPRRL